jgi:hypothetical protein
MLAPPTSRCSIIKVQPFTNYLSTKLGEAQLYPRCQQSLVPQEKCRETSYGESLQYPDYGFSYGPILYNHPLCLLYRKVL